MGTSSNYKYMFIVKLELIRVSRNKLLVLFSKKEYTLKTIEHTHMNNAMSMLRPCCVAFQTSCWIVHLGN